MSRRTALVFLYVLAACLGFGCSRAPDEPGEKPGVTQPAGMQRAPSVSDRGMRSAKSGEGLRFQPSDDPTEESLSEWRQGAAIGYGHFIQQPEWAKYRNGISREEADELFDGDVQRVAERVNRLVKVELSQHQFDAIVSLAFNIGCAAFEDSSTLKLINDPKAKTPYGDLESAWKAWNKYSSRNAEVRASVRDEPLFGIYVITDYTRYRGGLTPETSARGQVDTEAIISRDLYAVLKARIPNPRYAIRYYEDLPEGEVPCGQRRLLSNFWGFGTERDGVTVLDVYQASQGELPYLYLEVIDNDTLWVGYDGWLFQLRRKGAKGPTVPLKQRYPSDGDDPDTSGLEAPEPTPGMISRAKSKHWRIRGHKAEALAGATLSGLAWAITGDLSDYRLIKFGRAPETLRKGETVDILPLLRKAGGISDADVRTGCRLVKSRID